MRILIYFSKNSEPVPNNQQIVNSYIHKCLGNNNEYHDKPSDYCISRLLGKNFSIVDSGRNLDFPNGSYIIITSMDYEFINKIIMGVINNQDFGYGMKFINIDNIEEPFFNGWNFFKTTKMGFILRNKERKFYTLENIPELTFALKEQIIRKFGKIAEKQNISFDFSDLEIQIIEHPQHKTKNIYCKNIKNLANICQINIFTNKKLAKYIYNYGIGQSTGSGFGTIYTAKFHSQYK